MENSSLGAYVAEEVTLERHANYKTPLRQPSLEATRRLLSLSWSPHPFSPRPRQVFASDRLQWAPRQTIRRTCSTLTQLNLRKASKCSSNQSWATWMEPSQSSTRVSFVGCAVSIGSSLLVATLVCAHPPSAPPPRARRLQIHRLESATCTTVPSTADPHPFSACWRHLPLQPDCPGRCRSR